MSESLGIDRSVDPSLDLSVDLGGLRLPGSVMVAAGCFGTGTELDGLVDRSSLGGVVSRSITATPVKGPPTPRMAETPSGMLSAVGLQNPGIERFLSDELPGLTATRLPVFVSVAGRSLEEYVRVTSLLQGLPGVVAIETCLSAPDEERGGEPFTSRPEHAAEAVGAVARLSSLPVFAKLPGVGIGVVETARACVRAGAHGLTLIDAVPGMAVDTVRLAPQLGSAVGGLSGPAIRPIAVAAVYEVARELPDVPILGVGGVSTGDDAVELMLAGASAVQVGTALLVDPMAPAAVVAGVADCLERLGLDSVARLRGRAHPDRAAASAKEL